MHRKGSGALFETIRSIYSVDVLIHLQNDFAICFEVATISAGVYFGVSKEAIWSLGSLHRVEILAISPQWLSAPALIPSISTACMVSWGHGQESERQECGPLVWCFEMHLP